MLTIFPPTPFHRLFHPALAMCRHALAHAPDPRALACLSTISPKRSNFKSVSLDPLCPLCPLCFNFFALLRVLRGFVLRRCIAMVPLMQPVANCIPHAGERGAKAGGLAKTGGRGASVRHANPRQHHGYPASHARHTRVTSGFQRVTAGQRGVTVSLKKTRFSPVTPPQPAWIQHPTPVAGSPFAARRPPRPGPGRAGCRQINKNAYIYLCRRSPRPSALPILHRLWTPPPFAATL